MLLLCYALILTATTYYSPADNTSTASQIIKKHQPLLSGLLDKRKGRKTSYLTVQQ